MKTDLIDYNDFSSDEEGNEVLITSKKSTKPIQFDVEQDEITDGEDTETEHNEAMKEAEYESAHDGDGKTVSDVGGPEDLVPLSAKDLEKEKLASQVEET